ncbi:DUF2273 domain-containing protein [Melissococcus plutonius]|uniref:Small integral membrane protein n=1 Tax=Melissococcus plutonius TaxID=33970 RepID=A0A2Z5Y271_9ENTE|nr:DUF2273 domain-containing protein [Melissococcus plutonius]BAL62010.1 hypothetical protein MPD5_0767 [Melissococcus plutonius DAT561]MCV2499138.1 DUF2273 domain-containing protein [Melissococcus plutonius]MCV2500324.1 DUF2273 domain-containing protein [Melissococcus plutonius]MCV2505117.1 DUF2273 domain-containing protein [Melissococcus plutonius]MCV2507643.1 DUF2273 domain-containing protein [Melissococcus plutonius]
MDEKRKKKIEERGEKIKKDVQPYRFRMMWSLLFFLLSLVLLSIGFWKSFILILFAAIGYIIGKMRDDNLDVYSLIDSIKSIGK